MIYYELHNVRICIHYASRQMEERRGEGVGVGGGEGREGRATHTSTTFRIPPGQNRAILGATPERRDFGKSDLHSHIAIAISPRRIPRMNTVNPIYASSG